MSLELPEVRNYPDGTTKIEFKRGAKDEGKYRIENGQFCSTWTTLRGGKEKCFRVYEISENTI